MGGGGGCRGGYEVMGGRLDGRGSNRGGIGGKE